jgi:hypothetical protein
LKVKDRQESAAYNKETEKMVKIPFFLTILALMMVSCSRKPEGTGLRFELFQSASEVLSTAITFLSVIPKRSKFFSVVCRMQYKSLMTSAPIDP